MCIVRAPEGFEVNVPPPGAHLDRGCPVEKFLQRIACTIFSYFLEFFSSWSLPLIVGICGEHKDKAIKEVGAKSYDA